MTKQFPQKEKMMTMLSKAQRNALQRGAREGKRMRDFNELFKEELQKLKKEDSLKAKKLEEAFFKPSTTLAYKMMEGY